MTCQTPDEVQQGRGFVFILLIFLLFSLFLKLIQRRDVGPSPSPSPGPAPSPAPGPAPGPAPAPFVCPVPVSCYPPLPTLRTVPTITGTEYLVPSGVATLQLAVDAIPVGGSGIIRLDPNVVLNQTVVIGSAKQVLITSADPLQPGTVTSNSFSVIQLDSGTLVLDSVKLVNTLISGSAVRLGPFFVLPVGLADLYIRNCQLEVANNGVGNFSASGARFQIESTTVTCTVKNSFNPSFVESQNVLYGDCIISNCTYKPTVRTDDTAPSSRYFFQQESGSPTDPSFNLLIDSSTVVAGSFGNVLRNVVQINIHPLIASGNRTINLLNMNVDVYGPPILWTRSLRLGIFCNEMVLVNCSFETNQMGFTPTTYKPCIAFDNQEAIGPLPSIPPMIQFLCSEYVRTTGLVFDALYLQAAQGTSAELAGYQSAQLTAPVPLIPFETTRVC